MGVAVPAWLERAASAAPVSVIAAVFAVRAVLWAVLTFHVPSRQYIIRRHLRGKHVWITGASQGLGFELARQARNAGARVTISGRSPDKLSRAVQAINHPDSTEQGVETNGYIFPPSPPRSPMRTSTPRSSPFRTSSTPPQSPTSPSSPTSLFISQSSSHSPVLCVVADVSDPRSLRSAHARVEAGHGRVDVVIANAGINHSGFSFRDLDDHTMERITNTNLLGVSRTFSCVLPAMISQKRGSLCAISSLAAYRGVPGASIYGATKAAVSSFCQSLRVELLRTGVSVTCVHPGFIDTPAIASLDHPKPMQVSSEDAAERTLYAIARGWGHYGFPWPMEHLVMPFSLLLPAALYEYVLHFTNEDRGRRKQAHSKMQ